MNRRDFIKSVAGTAAMTTVGGIAAPAVSQRVDARTLRLVPHADLANFDPIWTPAYIARNAGILVWDMLYGVDAKLQPQRQMVEAEEVSTDGLTWSFRLRQGLTFHDGERVTARDAVASINRWAAREPMGQMIKARENELAVIDDRTFRWSLKTPFPKLLLALGKVGTPCCFIMPERIAATDPFKLINEYVGSGPMRFLKDEWQPGAHAAFARFQGYVARPEPASWLAGGKRIAAERIEWKVLPDPTTAAAALQNGEVDWWELVTPDLIPALRRNRDIVADISDPLGWFGFLVLNHAFPPFNDVRARRAILMAIDQADYMRAFVGDDPAISKPAPGYFTPGTPLYNEEGGDILTGPRNLDAARRLLGQSGYAGEPIVCMASQDLPHHKAWGEVTHDMLRRLGVNVDYVAVDWGTVVARRAQKKEPKSGGWHMYHTSVAGADCVYPTNQFLRATGKVAVNGWAESSAVEAEIATWFAAGTREEEQAAARRINKAALEHAVYAPLGFYLRYFAWRRNLTGIAQAPLPFFWNVTKTA